MQDHQRMKVNSSHRYNLLAVKKENMNNGGSETGEAKTISRCKEGCDVEGALTLIRIQINVKIRIYNR